MTAEAFPSSSSKHRSQPFARSEALAIACASLSALLPASVMAQSTTTGATDRLDLLHVLERLDPLALALIAAGALIFVLLVMRIWSMIRGERATVTPARQRRGNGGDELGGATISAATDWGFDQNKRAALARSAVVIGGTSTGLASMDMAATMWSSTDVENAAAMSLQANDAMGKSPNPSRSPYTTSYNPYFHAESTTAPIEVVEVADTLLQAELLVQLGDPKQAMVLLSQHIRDTEKPGPGVWLMLLNLYQTTGRQSQYEALAIGFKTLFNAAVPPWPATPDASARDLESYPEVVTKLQAGWPQPAVRTMLEALLNDDRGGSRQGFSLAAYREILFLIEVLDVLERMDQEEIDREQIKGKLDLAV